MTFTDAAREVLRQGGKPLHYKEITELAIENNLLSHVGKSPEVTMGARLAATLKKGGDDNPLIRVKPGVFALREWDEETIKQGLDIKRTAKKKSGRADGAPAEAEASAGEDSKGDDEPAPPAEPEEASTPPAASPIEVDETPQAPDEELRAEIVKSALDVFEAEDDDDQPILQPPPAKRAADKPAPDKQASEDGPGEPADGRRRRRRRRRRGSRSNNTEQQDTSGLPSYTTSPAFDGDEGPPPRGPQVIELTPTETPALDGLAGRDLADAIALILGSFDRTVGAVSLRQIAETAQRRGKLSGDLQLAQSQIAAAVRADLARRSAAGVRPRFRIAGGRVGLIEWLLDPELARLEREAVAALARYREASRRAFVRKCSELPGHAFIELCVTLLEAVGVTQLHHVKFPGASGAEAHFAGVLHTPSGALPGPVGEGVGLKLAVVIRKDGRDLGRERVTELRGTAHHYDSAKMGWIITGGQVLSGAREESSVNGVFPVTMLDGMALARLCEEHAVAVVRSVNPIAIPDVDLFEALRAS